jgi:hypothetical protein
MFNSDKLAADVAEYSWVVMKVVNDLGPDFAYSVGLYHSFRHPELIMFGLRSDTMHRLINAVGERVRRGAGFRAGQLSDEFLEGFDVTFRAVPAYQLPGHFGWAIAFYRGQPFPALQVIYPDRKGRWPWTEAAEDDFRERQPVLADISEPPWSARPST